MIAHCSGKLASLWRKSAPLPTSLQKLSKRQFLPDSSRRRSGSDASHLSATIRIRMFGFTNFDIPLDDYQ